MNAQSLKILLIDANPTDAELIEVHLREIRDVPFRLERAQQLSAGLRLLAGGRFDVVLLDPALPDCRGLEAVAQVVEWSSGVPVVILTQQEEVVLGLAAVRLGAQDYLVKGQLSGPVIARTLHSAVERCWALGQLRQSEAHLRLLIDQLPAILWTTDLRLYFTSSLGADLLDLRLRPGEVIGLSLFDYFQTTDSSLPVIAAHQRALRGESVSLDVDWRDRTYHTHVEPLYRGGHITGTIGVALDITDRSRVEEEMRVARKIQQGLLPRSSPVVAGFDVAGLSYPAEATGGDYYDFIPMNNGSLGVVIGDVSGHGFGPALLMASTRAYLRALTRVHHDVSEILTLANRILINDIHEDHFVTLLFACFEPRTGPADAPALVYASAGHPAGYLFDASGEVKTRLASTSVPLGVDPNALFPARKVVPLEPGDIVLFFTDGVVEAFAPDQTTFGHDRVRGVIRLFRDFSARILVDNLYHAVRAFSQNAPQLDDISAVVIKVGPKP